MEADIFTQVKGISQTIAGKLPALRKPGDKLAAFRIEENKRVIHRAQRNTELRGCV